MAASASETAAAHDVQVLPVAAFEALEQIAEPQAVAVVHVAGGVPGARGVELGGVDEAAGGELLALHQVDVRVGDGGKRIARGVREAVPARELVEGDLVGSGSYVRFDAPQTRERHGVLLAHGTGTEANDRSETIAMKKVFPNIKDIPISSTKAYVGHNIGSAGIIEFIACLLTLPEGKVLPTLNFTEPRIGCDLNYVPNEFQDHEVKVFLKNNYAFGGNNCCVVTALKPETTP